MTKLDLNKRRPVPKTARITAVVAMAVLLVASVARAQDESPPADPPADRPVSAIADDPLAASPEPALAAVIEELIAKLGDSEYAVRADATERLIAIGLPAFPRLHDAYHKTDQLEVRLRIERIVHAAYMDHYLYRPNAFLGVAQARYTPTTDDDPRIPTGHIGIEVSSVIADSAAARAPLIEGDIIVAVDDEPLSGIGRQATVAFGELIRLRGPGAMIKLTILRGPQTMHVELTLDRRPAQYYERQDIVTELREQVRAAFTAWWIERFRQPGGAKSDR